MNSTHSFGIIGLGKMGGNLAIQACEKNYRVFGKDTKPLRQELIEAGVVEVHDYKELAERLSAPRILFISIPAGKAVDMVIDDLARHLGRGDIIVEGGNSYWGDSIDRAERMSEKGIHFIDCGISGGVEGARNGACFMAGGAEKAFRRIEPVLKDLSVEDGYMHTGPSGTGHFVKLVHNGIEFGMLQAIGEGISLLQRFDCDLDLEKILHNWNHGSVIRSWLVELMEDQLRTRKDINTVSPYIEDTGEVDWLVGDAMNLEVPIPVISQSVMQLFASRDEQRDWARAIAMMRNGFGGHPIGKNEAFRREREISKVGDYARFRKISTRRR